MRVTIEGSVSQVQEACWTIGEATRQEIERQRQHRSASRQANKERRERIAANRKTIHRAYLIARRDPTLKGAMTDFVAALTGRAGISDELLLAADVVIAGASDG